MGRWPSDRFETITFTIKTAIVAFSQKVNNLLKLTTVNSTCFFLVTVTYRNYKAKVKIVYREILLEIYNEFAINTSGRNISKM